MDGFNLTAWPHGPQLRRNQPLPSLSLYVPAGWQHGDQWAPEELKLGMRLHNLLPSVSEPKKSLTLRDVNYTASIGPPGSEDEIFLRRT
ncbi:hypothetical protein FBZ94_110100 [Bradyrhizobium sacchari]|uniref:Uncharacterized protein n=1 Tax=Bradyrhizobium sacchari TaxID=1399419 RepID=A0A560JJD2_9BRAD|nr:hypothetical protein FBZ94_110100 [Bradyrhizobium sacchari]TWB69504.1 hypothetical protein FBZ95_109100 [Bradyrhizobium sacchari]